ncbi:MAG: zinc ribbon domain-containing protein [Oscillibacter sp.]|nr:zinc ribbon domain-containing protein [Oscillibacter sp.]
MFCRYCGNELPGDAKFCNNCGKAVVTGWQEQEITPEPTQAEPLKAEPVFTPYTIGRVPQKSGSKKIIIAAIIVLVAALAGVFGVRATNEKALKQQVPQSIYEDSEESVVAHYDKTMAYPYGNVLGYSYGCHYPSFEFTKGDRSNTFNVDGELEVVDLSQEDRPSYKIGVHGTVTTNFFRSEWSAEWELSYQDPVYKPVSYSASSTPAISVIQFREQFTSYSGEYVQPHVPSEYGGFTEGSGHTEVTVNLEAVSDNRMNANISVYCFSDSARIAEVSISEEMEIQPMITVNFDDDGWGNKGVLNLLFLENGEIGVWSEITEYSEYANWELYIEYVELAMTSTDAGSGNDSLPNLPINTSSPFGYYEKNGGGAIEIGCSTDESEIIYFRFYKDRMEGFYGGSWVQEEDYSAYFDWFDVTNSTWNLNIDSTRVSIYITNVAMTVTADGPLGSLSATQINGTYYCKDQAITE